MLAGAPAPKEPCPQGIGHRHRAAFAAEVDWLRLHPTFIPNGRRVDKNESLKHHPGIRD
jgi:hypothetical protein